MASAPGARWTAVACAATLALLAGGGLATPAVAEGAPASADVGWPTYAADLAGSRYRPLDQINASNFSNLEVAWRFKTDSLGTRPEYKLEGTPLEVDGVVYATAGTRRAVIALDAVTGELLWVHGEKEGARGAASPRQLSGRGLAYWSDGKEKRVLYVTPGLSPGVARRAHRPAHRQLRRRRRGRPQEGLGSGRLAGPRHR